MSVLSPTFFLLSELCVFIGNTMIVLCDFTVICLLVNPVWLSVPLQVIGWEDFLQNVS